MFFDGTLPTDVSKAWASRSNRLTGSSTCVTDPWEAITPGADAYVIIIDSTTIKNRKDPVTGKDIDFTYEYIKHITNQLKRIAEANPSGKISRMPMLGHGNPAQLDLIGLILEDINVIDGSYRKDIVEMIASWSKYFSDDAYGINLRMCYVAKGERGMKFLASLSLITKQRVTGCTGMEEGYATGDQVTVTPKKNSPNEVVAVTRTTGKFSVVDAGWTTWLVWPFQGAARLFESIFEDD